MFAQRRKSVLLALWACVQLVLAPAFRPAGCAEGGAVGGLEACCCVVAPASTGTVTEAGVADAGVGQGAASCCGGAPSAGADHRGPTDRGEPGGEGDGREGDRRGRCACVHAPAPWPPADEGDARADARPSGLFTPWSGPAIAVAIPAAPRIVRPAGAPSPGDPGPALHLLHCVFLD